MAILVTGAAGFIGSWTARELLKNGHDVVGIDNFNDYYNPEFKKSNVKGLKIKLYKEDIRNYGKIRFGVFCDLKNLWKIHHRCKVHLGSKLMDAGITIGTNGDDLCL